MTSDALLGFESWHVPIFVMTAIVVGELVAVRLFGRQRGSRAFERVLLVVGLAAVCVLVLRGG